MKKKIKLRDLTKEEYKKWCNKHCPIVGCQDCVFGIICCDVGNRKFWLNNKDLYSDKFLNQEIEIEIEVPELLTKEEKEYLETVLKPLYESGVIIKYLVKHESIIVEGFERLNCMSDEYCYNTLRFKKGTMFKNMELDKEYTLKDLGLFKEEKHESTSISTEKKITLTDFWNSKQCLGIHCHAEEEANKLLKAFDRLGKRWSSGDLLYSEDNNWDDFEERTVYDNIGKYGSYDCYQEDNYTIYEFNEVDLEN